MFQIVPADINVLAMTVHYQTSNCLTGSKEVAAHVSVLCIIRQLKVVGSAQNIRTAIARLASQSAGQLDRKIVVPSGQSVSLFEV